MAQENLEMTSTPSRALTRQEQLISTVHTVTKGAIITGARRGGAAAIQVLSEHYHNHFQDLDHLKIGAGEQVTTYPESIRRFGKEVVKEQLRMALTIPIGVLAGRIARAFFLGSLEGATYSIHQKLTQSKVFQPRRGKV